MDNTLGHASKTGDSATLEYQQTGLQTENKTATAEKQQLPENDVLPEVGVDEREVTDPVTHLPITIHDATDVELECIPPPPSTPQLQPEEEDAQKLDSDKRHKAMEDLVEKETDGRWVDTDERERKTAFVAGAVATFGALVLFACTLAAAGRQGIWFGFVEVTIGVFGCGVVGLGTRFAVVGISVSGSQLHSKQEGEQEV